MKRRNLEDGDEVVKSDDPPSITEEMIKKALREIKNPDFAKMTGLICHIAYWCIFGHLSNKKLNDSIKDKINKEFEVDDLVKDHFLLSAFVEISRIKSQLDMKYLGKYIYASLIMPVLVL